MRGLVQWRKMTWQLKAGLAVAALLALVKFGLVPLYEWRGETLERIESLKESLAVKRSLVGKKSGFKVLLVKAKSAYDEVLGAYYQDFTDPQSLQLILQKEMERLASACNVKIVSTDWLYASKGDVVQAPIKLICTGLIDDIIRLIAAVEAGKKFVSMDRLQITSLSRAAPVKVEIDISAYGVKTGS